MLLCVYKQCEAFLTSFVGMNFDVKGAPSFLCLCYVCVCMYICIYVCVCVCVCIMYVCVYVCNVCVCVCM